MEYVEPIQKKEKKTGLPKKLQSGIEHLSGYSMNDVNVHHNSPEPAKVGALAYARGGDIFLGQGQEKHLPHEAWHVVQQKQGRVQPTMQMKNKVDDAPGLMSGSTAGNVDAPIQRYVSVTSDNKDTKADYVTLNSIAFGHQVAEGDIQDFKDSDFSKLAEGEKIAFVGHGGQRASGRYTGKAIGDKLISAAEGMPDGDHDITFTSCSAGARTAEKTPDSVIDKVKAKIKSRWSDSTATIKGAVSSSVKTFSTDGTEHWGVRNQVSRQLAGKVQGMLNKVYKLNIRDTPPLKGDVLSKAKIVQHEQRQYFLDLVHIINGNLAAVSKEAIAELNESGLMKEVEGGYSAENPMREV